jgi:catechol 2,3-dioxygenase-like lactoylglutathione lyase family enzyme
MKLDRIVIKVADYRKSFSFYHDIIGFRLKTSWQRTDSWGAIFYCGDIPLEIIWFPEGEENLACSYIPERSKVDIFLAVSNLDSNPGPESI